MRYVYLGDRLTDPALIGQPCDPILRADGKCLVGRKPRNQAVRFWDGREVVVLARRLRVIQPARSARVIEPAPRTTAQEDAHCPPTPPMTADQDAERAADRG